MTEGMKRALIGGIVGLVGLIGLFWASGAEGNVRYGLGLLIFVAAVLYEFRLIQSCFESKNGRAVSTPSNPARLIPRAMVHRVAAGGVAALVALLALAAASGAPPGGGGYEMALMVFVAGVLYIFLLIKAAFDDRGRA